jgi:hypothetical protein
MIPETGGVWWHRAVVLFLAIGVAMLLVGPGTVGWPGASAAKLQDGTDEKAISCSLAAEASEETESAEAPVAVASPVAAASPAARQPADAATATAIETVVRALAACLSEGQSETVAELVTERYLGAVYGGGGRLPREDYLALAPELPVIPVTVSAVTDVRIETDRRATADVVTVVGHQLVHGRWTFVYAVTGAGGGRWQVDDVVAIPVETPAGAARVAVDLTEYEFTLSRGRVARTDVVLAGTNTGREDHEILVLRLDRDVSTDVLLREPGPGLPEGVRFIGQVTVPPGGQADLVLVDLPPGNYTLVCLLPTEDGTPHLALGMTARLRVTAP